MAKIGKEAERKILGGLVEVDTLVRAGTSPSAAIAKVAAAARIPPGHVRLMVNAYNTGRTNRQRSDADDVFDKVAEFELADAAAVLAEIYPATVKTAAATAHAQTVSDEYAAPPDWAEKRARLSRLAGILDDEPQTPKSTHPRDPRRFDKKAAGALHKLANQRAELLRRLDADHDKVAADLGSLCRYFRVHGSLPLDAVRENCEALYGAPAAAVFAKVAAMTGTCHADKPVPVAPRRVSLKPPADPPAPSPRKIKRASALHPVDRLSEPYRTVETLLEAAADYGATLAEAIAFEKGAALAELELGRALAAAEGDVPAPLAADPSLSIARRLRGEKRAFGPLGQAVATGAQLGLGAEAGRSIYQKLSPKSDDKLKQDAFESLTDPSHEARLKSIRSQSILHGVLNGPYFEGEDPRKVADLFNSITRLSPRLADQPIALEAAMKRLAAQGSADPHDLDQLLGIENKLKQRDDLPGGNSAAIGAMAPGLSQGPGGGGKKEEA